MTGVSQTRVPLRPGAWWLAGALALAGCATVTDLRQAGPADTFRSDRQVADIAPCLVDAWQTLSTAMAYYDVRTLPRRGGGMTVLVGNPSNSLPVLFVDLDPEPGSQRTIATYYAKHSVLSEGFFNTQVQVIKQCLEPLLPLGPSAPIDRADTVHLHLKRVHADALTAAAAADSGP